MPLIIPPGGRALVPTGFAIALPPGHEGQVRPRSGLAVKHGVTVLNAPGTIDADYRGEVKVALINHGDEPFAVTRGMRIAQLVVAPVTRGRACRSRRTRRDDTRQRRLRFDRLFGIDSARGKETSAMAHDETRRGRGKIYDSITDTVGDTPLVRLDRIAAMKDVPAHLVAKLEFFNPIASVKDRIGVAMVDALEEKPGASSPASPR